MSDFYLDKIDETSQRIINAAFPSYTGRKVKLSTSIPTNLSSYWDGGSRNYYAFVQLSTMKAFEVSSNHPIFEANNPSVLNPGELPPGVVVVKHTIFQGKDLGITIFANTNDLAPLLPAPSAELSDDEKCVLYYTRSLKSSYAGIKNFRQHSSGLSLERWEAAKKLCQNKGLLDGRGAITASGRNSCPSHLK